MTKFYIYVVVIMMIFVGSNVSEDRREVTPNPVAVTSLVGREDFYTRIKEKLKYTYVDETPSGQLVEADYTGVSPYISYPKQSQPLYLPTEFVYDWDLEDKSFICGRIFNSAFYDMHGQEPVEFHLRARNTMRYLEEKYKRVYDDIYDSYPRASEKWANPYKKRDVWVGGKEFQEWTIRCLTRERAAADLTYIEYFISPIYQSTLVEYPMNGRFVFTVSADPSKLKVVALAEGPAVLDRNVIRATHSAYYNARNLKRPVPNPSTNSVCELSEPDKIRLCAVVLNAPDFPDRVKFWPSKDYIEPTCGKKKVVARGYVDKVSKTRFHGVKQSEVYVEMVYEELMVGCKAVPVPENEIEISPKPTVASVSQDEAQEEKRSVLPVPERVDAEELKSSPIPNPDTEAARSKIATITYHIGPAIDKLAVIVYKRARENEYTPFAGLSKVHLVVDSGAIRPVSILEPGKN